MSKPEMEIAQKNRKELQTIEYVGLGLVALALVGLFFGANQVAETFDAMVNKAYEIIQVYISARTIGAAIIVSVMIGRILERLGFTDALMRIFVPIMKYIGVNSSVVIGVIYNILGDVNASGRIAAPVLMKAGATKDEQKIAIATLCQAQPSFSVFMLGILALTLANITVFPVIIVALFVPIVLVPFLLRITIWRDTKAVPLEDLPRFTPSTPGLQTVFGGAKEGAELVFLFIIPAGIVIFAAIGALEYFGIWQPFNAALTAFMTRLSIEPITGVLTIVVSNTLAMGTLVDMLRESAIAPHLVIGSFVLACSGFPLQVIFGQIPAVWAPLTDLSERECMVAAVVGSLFRLAYAVVVAIVLTPLVI